MAIARRDQKSSHRPGQSGQAIVLIAFAMIGLIAFMVLAIDGGKYYNTRRVAQNAADMSSMSGTYTYSYVTNGQDDQAVLTAIIQQAEANGVPDTDNVPSPLDSVNNNVHAFWVDAYGNYVCSNDSTVSYTQDWTAVKAGTTCSAEIVNNANITAPTGTNAVSGTRVFVLIPYTTFMGQMIGQRDLQGQADGISLLTLTKTPTKNGDKGAWMTGYQCGGNGTTIDTSLTGNIDY